MWINKKPLLLPFDRPRSYTFYFGGDWQLGSRQCDRDVVKSWVSEVSRDRGAVWSMLGDIEDEDRPTTRSRRRSANADRPEVNARDVEKHLAWVDRDVVPLMRPLTRRPCMGILAGHHWTQISDIRNSVQYIAGSLTKGSEFKVPYLGVMEAWSWVEFRGEGAAKGESIRRLFHLQHGVGGSSAVGSALKKLEKTSKGKFANVYVRGHDCKLESAKIDVVYPSRPHQDRRIYHRTISLLNIGSATRALELTKGDPPYSEHGGMSPLTLGWGKIIARIREYQPWEERRDGRKFTCDFSIEI